MKSLSFKSSNDSTSACLEQKCAALAAAPSQFPAPKDPGTVDDLFELLFRHVGCAKAKPHLNMQGVQSAGMEDHPTSSSCFARASRNSASLAASRFNT